MNRSPNSIADELRRNKVKGCYDPAKAQHKAYVRRKQAKFQGKKIVEHRALRKFVEKALLEDRSPESIAGRVNHHEKHLPNISADSVERFLKSVHGRKIEAARNKRKQHRKRRRKRPRNKKLTDRTFIDKRPQIISKRERVGDTEADFIVSGRSGQGHVLTVVDRKLRVAFIEKVWPVSIHSMEQAFLKIKKRYPELRTITTDNDLLFVQHKRLGQLLGVTIYFCHPYHSWEKGSIENVNGEIRKNIPKGSDLSRYTSKNFRAIEDTLNERFMDCLNFATPQEKLLKHRQRKNRAGARER